MGGAKVSNPKGVLGTHPNLRRALAAARRVGPTRRAVLIRGESGTGKERLASLVHEASGRRGAFVAINCATLVESLLESELFGHERGAFTGASGQKKGLFEAAHRGTLFLNEIGDLPVSLQAGLLRVLQEGRVRRVGGTVDVEVDVRIVAATHRDLLAMSADGSFRLDLYHRLVEYRVHLPPMRERGRDVVTIARHLLAHEFAGDTALRLCRDAEDLLVSYPWPGNIRELRNVLSRVALDVPGRRITATHLRAALPRGRSGRRRPRGPGPGDRRARLRPRGGRRPRAPASAGERGTSCRSRSMTPRATATTIASGWRWRSPRAMGG